VSYSLVWLLIWPTSTREAFEDVVRRLVGAHRQLAARCLAPTIGETPDAGAEALRRQSTQGLARLGGLLDGAEMDSYHVWEARHAWRGLIHWLSQLTSASERWRQSLAEVRELDLRRPLPELPEFAAELDHRFAEIGRMLDGHPPERGPTPVPLNPEDGVIASLSRFQQAAFLVYRGNLEEVDKLTRNIFDMIADIRSFTPAKVYPAYDAAPLLPSALDPERLAGVARWLAGLWLAWFIALYVPDLPNTVAFIALPTPRRPRTCAGPTDVTLRPMPPCHEGTGD
jgi:hypothetical protein